MRHRPLIASVLVCSFAMIGAASPVAVAQSVISVAAISISAESEIASALYTASATREASERSADARIRSLRTEIDGLRTEATRLKASGAAQGQAAEAARAELAGAEERFVAELASRDRAYAQEIAVFRSAVERTASTPEGLAALELYNQGERLKARETFLELQRAASEARRAASQMKDDIAEANDLRDIAAYELDMRNRGELTTLDLIARYEEITVLDPGVHRDWVELGRLYMSAGKLGLAETAARRSAETAGDDREAFIALSALGDVLVAKGDAPGARSMYEASLDLNEGNQVPGKADVDLLRDRSVVLIKLGDALIAEGSFEQAAAAYDRSIKIVAASGRSEGWTIPRLNLSDEQSLASMLIADRLDSADPLGTSWRRTKSIEISPDVLAAREGVREAQAGAASLGDRAWQLSQSVTLDRIGDILLAQGDTIGAMQLFRESLAIKDYLLAASPEDVQLRRNRSVSLEKVGDAMLARGDLKGAKEAYEECLALAESLSESDRSNAGWQRDLLILNVKMGSVADAPSYFKRALSVLADMKANGTLADEDSWMEVALRKLPGAE